MWLHTSGGGPGQSLSHQANAAPRCAAVRAILHKHCFPAGVLNNTAATRTVADLLAEKVVACLAMMPCGSYNHTWRPSARYVDIICEPPFSRW